jgi:hypothetical protein
MKINFRFIKENLASDYIRSIILRYFLYALGALDSLIVPLLLKNSPETYSNIEYLKNAILLFPNILLGSYSGYTYIKYNRGIDLFGVLLKIGFLISITLATLTGILLNNYTLIFPLLFINLYVIIEQKLKVDKNFVLAFLFKPLLAIFSILIALLNYLFNLNINHNIFILNIFSLAFLVWAIPSRQYFLFSNNLFTFSKIEFLKYFLLIKKIFTGVLASLIFGLLIFLERFIIEKYYKTNLSSYSFAFNLSQIIVILISAFSYLSTIYLGEQINSLNKKKLILQLKLSMISYVILFTFFSCFVILIQPFYSHFNNLILITILITFSKGYFAVVGIFSPIAVYKDYNTKMFITILSIFIINALTVVFLANQMTPLTTILIVDGIFILLYSFYILDIVFRRIVYSN